MIDALKVTQVIISLLLIVVILIQSKGTGLSIAPGSNDFGKFEKRGPEKTLHIITMVLGALFVLNATAYFLVA